MPAGARITISIPTYNRAAKLRRTLKLLAEDAMASNVTEAVEILVSDNASPDNTSETMQEVIKEFPQMTIRYQRHPQNLGISGNLVSLYRGALGEYVWFFADDDLPFPGCIKRILTALEQHTPSVLLYSFMQPRDPTSKYRLFDFPEDVHMVTDPRECIQLLLRNAKISLYVLRRSNLTDEALNGMESLQRVAPMFGWLKLPIEVLDANKNLTMAIISEPLASCDESYSQDQGYGKHDGAGLGWNPVDWKAEARLFDHPYVKNGAVELYANREKWTYTLAIDFYWAWRTGFYGIAERMEPQWWAALRKFPIQWRWAMANPRMLIRLVALKTAPKRLPAMLVRMKRSIRG